MNDVIKTRSMVETKKPSTTCLARSPVSRLETDEIKTPGIMNNEGKAISVLNSGCTGIRQELKYINSKMIERVANSVDWSFKI
jgi:hypothetical protein